MEKKQFQTLVQDKEIQFKKKKKEWQKKLFNNDIYKHACVCFQGKFIEKMRKCKKEKKNWIMCLYVDLLLLLFLGYAMWQSKWQSI